MITRPGEPTLLARGEDFLIAAKPVGLATTGRTLDDPDCLQYHLMSTLKRRKVWAVHQLDKGTSGVCLFALKKASVATLSERLRAGRKLYLGLCEGRLGEAHDVHAKIGRITRSDGRTQAAITRRGKDAHTRVWPIEVQGEHTLVAAQIYTGRTHQVRLHLAHLGLPLIGESLHRTPPCNRLPYPALHAWCLELHGDRDTGVSVVAPVPEALASTLLAMGFALPEPSEVGF